MSTLNSTNRIDAVGTIRTLLLGIVIACMWNTLIGASQPSGVTELIQAKKIEIVTDEGKTVLELGSIYLDRGYMSIFNNVGSEVVHVGVVANDQEQHGVIWTNNKQGKLLTMIGWGGLDSGMIVILEGSGKRLVKLHSAGGRGVVAAFEDGEVKEIWPRHSLPDQN